MPPTDSLPFANENQLLGKEERIECNQEIDSVSDETTDDDGDSICSEASDTETVDTQRNASGLSIGDNSFLSDEYTFVHLEETFNPVNVSGLEENEQDLRTSIEPNLEEKTDIVNGVVLTKLGKDNRRKLQITGQYPDGPKPKKCRTCNHSMDWRTTGTLKPRKKLGILSYYDYNTAHNGNCVKEAYNAKAQENEKVAKKRIMEINVELSKALIDVKRKELENEKANLIESNKHLKAKKVADDAAKNGICKGVKNDGCPEKLSVRMGNRLCDDCYQIEKPIRDKKNKAYNGTTAAHKSLSDHYARKKGRPDCNISIEERLEEEKEQFKHLMRHSALLFDAKRIIIWDTESDDVGAGHSLDSTREVYCQELFTERVLNIRRYMNDAEPRILNDSFSIESTARQFMKFQDGVDYLIAYEPPSNDRNRMKEILDEVDESWYPSIEHKFICLKRALLSKICSTDNLDEEMIYLRDLMQPTIYGNLLSSGSIIPPYFFPVEESWSNTLNGINQKCKKDVHQLANIFLLLCNFFVSQ